MNLLLPMNLRLLPSAIAPVQINTVIPANAGIQRLRQTSRRQHFSLVAKTLDPRVRGDDEVCMVRVGGATVSTGMTSVVKTAGLGGMTGVERTMGLAGMRSVAETMILAGMTSVVKTMGLAETTGLEEIASAAGTCGATRFCAPASQRSQV